MEPQPLVSIMMVLRLERVVRLERWEGLLVAERVRLHRLSTLFCLSTYDEPTCVTSLLQ